MRVELLNGAALLDDLNHILVLEHVGQPNALRRMLHARAPHHGVIKIVEQGAMHLLAASLDGRAMTTVSEDDRVLEIRLLAARLGVYPHEAEVFPQHVLEDIEVEAHLDRQNHGVGHRADPRTLLDRGHVDLVVYVQAAHVFSIALDDVYELVDSTVLPEEYLGRMDLELVQQLAYVRLGDVDELAGGRDGDRSILLALKVHVGWTLVEPQSNHIQLMLKQLSLAVGLARGSIHDEQDKVA
mmetsp:Transcript_26429/g.53099  ORF Transcript_26429/g.53099 Transcript_26429/m.53099 type:complete len:241 (-) Transcript_26429:501-1223(-)